MADNQVHIKRDTSKIEIRLRIHIFNLKTFNNNEFLSQILKFLFMIFCLIEQFLRLHLKVRKMFIYLF